MYKLRGVDANGNEMWYTGKAGTAWVSPSQWDAFTYQSRAETELKATLFKRRTYQPESVAI